MGQLIRKALANGIINNAKVAADAAINVSKLEALTADRAIITNGSGVVAPSSVTATELGYVSGVTSSIQTQFTGKISTTEKGAANGVATLGADGKLPSAQVPALAISDTFVVASEVAMLALTVEPGDVAVRTDINKTFILRLADATDLASWVEILTPASPVQSVNGQTGTVVLDSDDVGEGTTNLYHTDERSQDAVAAAIAAGAHTALDITYTDASNKFDFAAKYDNSSIGINGSNQLEVKAAGVTNAMLAGSIEDAKLNTITTANKVSGSAVQLNAEASISNSTGLKALKPKVEVVTLIAGDITNQYVTLASTPWSGSVQMKANGYGALIQGEDFTVAGSQVNFAGVLATAGAAALEAGDILELSYGTL